MGVNKVEYGGETLIDLTQDTVTADTLAEGATAHDASGEQIVGTMKATSSGDTEIIVGTWVFNDELTIPNELYNRSFSLNFISANASFYELYIWSNGQGISYYGDVLSSDAYYVSSGWCEESLKTITFLEEPTDTKFITWLKANAVKREESSTSNGLEMPQIRFASATYWDMEKIVTSERPLKLTVEIVGGGALQVGDKLQICVRRTYGYIDAMEQPYRKQKLRAQQGYVITEEDLDKRFLTITTDDCIDEWLFHNDRRQTSAHFDCSSAFYLRIKRVTKYAADKECDAIFSNIVTVWKTYNKETKEVNIK